MFERTILRVWSFSITHKDCTTRMFNTSHSLYILFLFKSLSCFSSITLLNIDYQVTITHSRFTNTDTTKPSYFHFLCSCFKARTAFVKKSFQKSLFYKVPELCGILCMITDLLFNPKIIQIYPFKVTVEGTSRFSLSLTENQKDSQPRKPVL